MNNVDSLSRVARRIESTFGERRIEIVERDGGPVIATRWARDEWSVSGWPVTDSEEIAALERALGLGYLIFHGCLFDLVRIRVVF
jgi:hypothetical protein